MNTKTHFRPLFLLILAGMLLLAAFPASAERSSAFVAHYTTASLSAQEQIARNLLNSERVSYSLPELTLDPELCRLARMKSEDMRDQHYFAHTSPTYGDVRSMLKSFGYPFTAAGENIAHHATIEKCDAALLSSPGHRRNIMSRAYTKFGVGVALDAHGYVYLTQIFAR